MIPSETTLSPTTQPIPNEPVIRIRPYSGWLNLNLQELWDYRDLLLFLAWRDVKVRYKQTILGASWAILQPLLSMVVFSIFFGRLAGLEEGIDVPYPIFSYTAMVPWVFFSTTISNSALSLVTSANLIKKIYFPRMVVPIATALAGLVDFALAFIVLILMMFGYGLAPTFNIIWLPLFLLQAMITALGVGLWLSAMNVQFRDVRYAIPFLVQLWLFTTPVVYPSKIIENETLRLLFGINPMVGVIEGFRWALLGDAGGAAPGGMLLVSALVSMTLFVTGLIYFRRMEKSFADVV